MDVHVETWRFTWKQQLEAETFDDELVERLRSIHTEYRAQLRRDATYRRIYEWARAQYFEERNAIRTQTDQELKGKTKDELFELAHVRPTKAYERSRYTMEQLREWIRDHNCDGLRSEHVRVQEVWTCLTDEQKQGLVPWQEGNDGSTK